EELVESSPVPEHDIDHDREVFGEQIGNIPGSHRFGERGEASDIAEEDGHGLLVPPKPDLVRRGSDPGREVRCEESFEVAANEQLAPDALRKPAVFDREGRDVRERDQELEILLAET